MSGVDEPSRVSLADAYALRTPDDSRALYARWAATYESEFVSGNGYVIPERVAEIFLAATAGPGPADASYPERLVLDVGCGTGLVAAAMIKHSPAAEPGWIVDGIDISPEMLSEAARKRGPDAAPLYRRLIEADLTAAIDIADGTYSAVISAGTFTHGHLGPNALSALIRLGRLGALFVIGINAAHYAALGFEARLEEEIRSGRIMDLTTSVTEIYTPGGEHSADRAVVVVFRRTA